MTLVSSGTKIAALCDIHGNLPALEAVLADVRSEGVDQVIVGGDVIPGRCPAARVSGRNPLGGGRGVGRAGSSDLVVASDPACRSAVRQDPVLSRVAAQ